MSSRPRILIVAYDFPPHGAIGTMRTLRLVRQLHAEGWDITVLTGSPRTYLPGTPVDAKLEAQVPSSVRVIQAYAVRGLDMAASAAGRLAGRARPADSNGAAPSTSVPPTPKQQSAIRRAKDLVDAALAIPDNDAGWIAPAVASGLWHMSAHGRPDVLYSSAPPWSGQAVALALARITGRPWLADFRDPWSRAPWRDWRQPFRQRAAAALEKRVIGRADGVLFVTRANLDEFAAFYGPASAARFHLVPNGCDPSEFHGVEPLPARPEFVLLHAGTLYGARNPLPLIRAIAAAVHRGALDRSRFRLRLLGNISLPVDLAAESRALGIDGVVEFVPRVTRAESLREMVSASALLLVQPGTTVSVPGKAYEYLAAGRPLLALTEEGETAALVRASGIGVAVHPEDPIDKIEAGLLELVAIASSAYAAPPKSLYDGTVHAASVTRLLGAFAEHGRRASAHRAGPAHPPIAGAITPADEPRR